MDSPSIRTQAQLLLHQRPGLLQRRQPDGGGGAGGDSLQWGEVMAGGLSSPRRQLEVDLPAATAQRLLHQATRQRGLKSNIEDCTEYLRISSFWIFALRLSPWSLKVLLTCPTIYTHSLRAQVDWPVCRGRTQSSAASS